MSASTARTGAPRNCCTSSGAAMAASAQAPAPGAEAEVGGSSLCPPWPRRRHPSTRCSGPATAWAVDEQGGRPCRHWSKEPRRPRPRPMVHPSSPSDGRASGPSQPRPPGANEPARAVA
eukprot:1355088-Alexandrium_andersonii.AAC.1